jgi:hypothetical protein
LASTSSPTRKLGTCSTTYRMTAAALILLEHHWAVPLRDAVMRPGGFRISDSLISPLDLVEIGLVTAEEAKRLHAQETAGAVTTT